MRADQGAVIALAGELLGIHGRDDEGVGTLDPRIGQSRPRGLGHEVGEALLALPEASHPGSGDPDVCHAPISNRVRPGVNVNVWRLAEASRETRNLTVSGAGTPPGP